MVSLRSDLAEVGLASCLFGVAAGVPPAVEPGILPGGLLCGRRRQFRVPRRHSRRQDAVLYGSQDGCRDSRKPAPNSHQASRLFLFLVLFGVKLSAADSESALSKWLQSQTHIQTWSAEVIQTRALKSLTQPLTATGHVWFAAPNRFRWELGSPPQTIAVRRPDEMLVIYPKLKRAEKYPLTAGQTGQWRDTLALLEAGLPHSQAELESRFRVLAEVTTNDLHEITLQPKSPSARRMMPQIRLAFSTQDFILRSTELQFADGSTMRNDFTRA